MGRAWGWCGRAARFCKRFPCVDGSKCVYVPVGADKRSAEATGPSVCRV